MKVGKVIKIKAVEVNRLLFLIGVLWLPVLLLSCSDENDEQRIDEEQKEGIRVDFGNEVGYTPEDLKNWPHALFVFENKECVEVQLLCLFLLWATEWWHWRMKVRRTFLGVPWLRVYLCLLIICL